MLLVSAVVIMAGLLVAYSAVETDSLSDMMSFRPESDDLRLYKVHVLMEDFRQYPIWGMGAGSETAMTENQLGDAMASENGLIESLAESGLVGTILFLAIAMYPAKRCYSFAKRGMLKGDLAGALLVMLIVALAPLTFGSSSKSVLVWLVLAIVNKHLHRINPAVPTEDSNLASQYC